MKVEAFIIVISLLYLGTQKAYAIPDWAKNSSVNRSGPLLKTICSGKGPSLDQARAESIASCKASAANQLSKNTQIKSLSIETEKNAAFHQEVSEKFQAKGLNCKIVNESIEEKEGFFQVWNQCEFNVSQVKIEDSENAKELPATAFDSNQKALSILSIPPCSDVLVRGAKPRKYECKNHPAIVLVEKGDEEIIVRADKHAPKTLRLNAVHEDVIRVQLERMN